MKAVAAFLTSEHQQQWHRVTQWSRDVLRPRPEAGSDDAARIEATALLRALGDAGLLATLASQDLRALCLLREAVAHSSPLADAVVAIQALGATPVARAGTSEQRTRWLKDITTGRVMTAFAMTEPDAGSDVASMQTTAMRDGGDWVLNGRKHLISNAGLADLYLVFAKTNPEKGSRGISVFLVPANTSGLSFGGAQVMAAAHPLGHLRFAGCRVPDSARLGPVDQGFKLGMATLDRIRPSVGAAACGLAARALDEATAHARQRRQFGQTLSDMPLIREKIGRMATALDAARLLVYRAAWEADAQPGRHSASAAMAKSFATEMAQRVVDDAVQIIGGLGVLVGHPVERLYRSVRALRIYEGATDIQRLIVAGALLDEAPRS
ncbi:MAG TPA: acyl-CoA dehydrogenase family protein [Vicinamibacterales bacterium]|nr:acyl-CoA dehydrogenase family protein [Vicinamibacterales bacterium]